MQNHEIEVNEKIPLKFISQDPYEGRIYANHIRVSFTDKEFQVEFADQVSTVMTDDDGNKFGAAVVKSRIVISPKLVPVFIEILEKSYRTFAESEKNESDSV